jgi:predicted Zn-dependent protease
MIQFLHDDESELAAVLAHELGHIIDSQCYQVDLRDRKSSEICEDRADSISITLLMKAHYNAYAAAGFMGKLMMFTGDTSVTSTFLSRMHSDHPASLDRIDHMRKTFIWACQQPWNNCQALTGEEPSASQRNATLASSSGSVTLLKAQGTVPAGAEIVVTLTQSLSSRDAQAGQTIAAPVAEDVAEIIPRGAKATLSVASLES